MSSNTVQETHGSRGFLIISITRVSKMVIKTIREQQRRHARQKMCQTTLLDCIKTQLFSALLRENTFRWLKCSTGCKSGSSGASGTGASLALLAFGKATAFSTLSPAAAADARAFLAGTAFGVGLDSSATAAAAVLRRRAAAVCKMHDYCYCCSYYRSNCRLCVSHQGWAGQTLSVWRMACDCIFAQALVTIY